MSEGETDLTSPWRELNLNQKTIETYGGHAVVFPSRRSFFGRSASPSSDRMVLYCRKSMAMNKGSVVSHLPDFLIAYSYSLAPKE